MPQAIFTALVILALAFTQAELALEGFIVEDHSGQTLASVRVRVRAANGEVVADRDTDRSGRFTTPDLEPDHYRVEASRPGYLPAYLDMAGPGEPVRLRMVRLGIITGQVLDAERRPVSGAFVFPLIGSGNRLRPLEAVPTDSSGAYRLRGLPPGRYRIGMSRSSYQDSQPGVAGAELHPSRFEINGGEEHERVDFVLPGGPEATVSGTVEGADGETVFAVGLARRDDPLFGVAVTKTDGDGGFALSGVPAGAYFVFVAGPVRGHSWRDAILGDDRQFARAEIDAAGQAIGGLALTPSEALSATLTLVSPESGSACPRSATVRLISLEAWGAETGSRLTLALDAPQSVGGLAPTRYEAVVEGLPPGCFQAGETVFDPRDDERPVVRLSAAARVEGRLLGVLSGEVRVVLSPVDSSKNDTPVRVAGPAPDGAFSFDGLRPGLYRVAVRTEGARAARWVVPADAAFEVEAIGDSVTEIELPAPPPEEKP